MSLSQRIQTLRMKHTEIDDLLHQEQIRPMPSLVRLQNFKREKLRLKDEMAFLLQQEEQIAQTAN